MTAAAEPAVGHHLTTSGGGAKEHGMNRSQQMLAAVPNGNLEKVKDMLRREPRYAVAMGGDGVPALHVAAGRGFEQIVATLIASGADARATGGPHAETALHAAARTGRAGTVAVLLAHGA